MRTTSPLLPIGAALLLGCGRPAGADAPPRYRLTVLPLPFSGYNEVDTPDSGGGINASGQIVGEFSVRAGGLRDNRVALWQRGRPLRILDKRPVTRENTESNRDFLYATAINARGEVVGVRTVTFSGAYSASYSTACILWDGRLNCLLQGFPSDPDTASAALGLNDRGDVVGGFVYDNTTADQVDSSAPPGTEYRHAFLRRDGRIRPLWQGVARGVNDRGEIVGVEDAGPDDTRAVGVLWRNGHVTRLPMQPVAINQGGEVAGNVPLTEETGRACVWRRGRVSLLSGRASRAYALNDRGAIVGEQDDERSRHVGRAALWRGGQALDLNRCAARPRGWVLTAALGINDRGWIIGQGSFFKSPGDKAPADTFTFLLTPR